MFKGVNLAGLIPKIQKNVVSKSIFKVAHSGLMSIKLICKHLDLNS